MTTMFEKDKRIIAQLRKDGRASLTSISKSTGITISTLFERLKQLRGQAITKFTCIVDFKGLVLLCQLGCPRTSRPLDWHEKVCCHAVCLPLANMEHGVADPRYKRLLG